MGAAAGLFALAGVSARRARGRRESAPWPGPAGPPAGEGRWACLVLPTYNESGTIREVVERALASTPEVDVLVVDDSSPDGTGQIAHELAASTERVSVLHRTAKKGLGRAYIAGFRHAMARPYGAFLEMDSDLSHDPPTSRVSSPPRARPTS